MREATVRELRNHGGDVLDRVLKGERVTITRSGKPVADLHRVDPARVSAEALLDRWRRLPRVDPMAFRADVDGLLDSTR